MVVPENARQAMSASAGRALHIHISSCTWSWAHIPARAAMAMSSMVSPAWGEFLRSVNAELEDDLKDLVGGLVES